MRPISRIVPKRDDKQKRLPLNEADMKEAKRNLDQLDGGDQLLFRLLATTGMIQKGPLSLRGRRNGPVTHSR
jgi:hypothetical protein